MDPNPGEKAKHLQETRGEKDRTGGERKQGQERTKENRRGQKVKSSPKRREEQEQEEEESMVVVMVLFRSALVLQLEANRRNDDTSA